MADLLTRSEVVKVMAWLRSRPEMKGFLRSALVALEAGLPATAVDPRTRQRLIVRRTIGAEKGVVMAELQQPDGSLRTVPLEPQKRWSKNTTIRLSPELHERICKYGEPGVVVRAAIDAHLAKLEEARRARARVPEDSERALSSE